VADSAATAAALEAEGFDGQQACELLPRVVGLPPSPIRFPTVVPF
jgi:hypothetical protein